MNGQERPINAFMIATDDGADPRLAVLVAGNFDQLNWVDEKTGEQIYMFSNLYDACLGVFMCIDELKECDFWKTSAYDPVGHLLYFQIHVEDSMQMFDTSMVS